MHDVTRFGIVLLLVAVALVAATQVGRFSARFAVPAPAIFLLVAAGASTAFGSLRGLSVLADQRIVTVALVLILFDGGMHIGLGRLRPIMAGVAWLGTAGTLVTAAAVAACAHGLFGFDWRQAMLLGTALAPTDPAVVFSVLGRREIAGRTGTLLEGESGANDPVGIALMVSVLGAHGANWSAVGGAVGEFALQMSVGAAIGVLGGWVLRRAAGSRLPVPALYPVRALALALLVYGAAAALHGSGFLAVFVAGIVTGDESMPFRAEIRGFAGVLATLGEIVAFTVLGLSVSLRDVVGWHVLGPALGLVALLVFVVRPVLVGAVLWPIRLRPGERVFVLWSGLKGAVPILLGTYLLSAGERDATHSYRVIFVVVAVSVLVQGTPVARVARWCRVPMRATGDDSAGPAH